MSPDHTQTAVEIWRKRFMEKDAEVDRLKDALAQEVAEKYNAYKRINELTEKLNEGWQGMGYD